MINLIPPAARASVTREYWLRVLSVWFFLFGTACVVIVVLLFPTYVLIRMQVGVLDATVLAASSKTATFDESVAALTLANTQAKILVGEGSTTPFSQYISDIESTAGRDVQVSQLTFERSGAKGTISVSGVAKTRQSLAHFSDTLALNKAFSEVNLPISNLIKDKDLVFSMNITLASSTEAH